MQGKRPVRRHPTHIRRTQGWRLRAWPRLISSIHKRHSLLDILLRRVAFDILHTICAKWKLPFGRPVLLGLMLEPVVLPCMSTSARVAIPSQDFRAANPGLCRSLLRLYRLTEDTSCHIGWQTTGRGHFCLDRALAWPCPVCCLQGLLLLLLLLCTCV